MVTRLLAIQNAKWESPGLIASYARGARLDLRTVKLFQNGGPGAQTIPFEPLERGEFSAVFSLGSSSTAYRPETNPRHDELVELFKLVRRRKIPSFSICYSMQLFSIVHGGKVAGNPAGKEVGFFEVSLTKEGKHDPVFGPIGTREDLQWHGDFVERLPPSAIHLGFSQRTRNQLAVLDDIHYLVQGDGQAAIPRMVRSWLRHDGDWATRGTSLVKESLVRRSIEREDYYRSTFMKITENFLKVAARRGDGDAPLITAARRKNVGRSDVV